MSFSQGKKSDQRADAAEAKAEQVYAEANRQLRIKIAEVEQDRPSIKLQMENSHLRKENQSLKERIVGLEELVHKLKEIIKEKLPEIYKSIVQSKQKTKKRGLER